MTKVLPPNVALTLMRLAQECHDGLRAFPPEIVAKQQQIKTAIENHTDLNDVAVIVNMKLNLDYLLAEWAKRETK